MLLVWKIFEKNQESERPISGLHYRIDQRCQSVLIVITQENLLQRLVKDNPKEKDMREKPFPC